MTRTVAFLLFGVAAGAMITIQSILNATLGARTGQLGSMLILTLVSIGLLIALITFFPATASFSRLPGPGEWYLYLGGILGICILAAPILLVPRIGAASTLTMLVLGQMVLAVLLDHFAPFDLPRTPLDLSRALGVLFLFAGAALIVKK